MTQLGQSWGFGFGFVRAWAMGGAITLMGGLALSGNRALAQIIPDATLGAERSIVTPNANVRTLNADLIEGGALRGTNLFHSFQEFNVGNGQRVYFANPAGIENILSRVTGNNLSKIFGTLGVNGGANLFLLNPNGIIFGPNARLDIAGSFVGSTANSLVWGNGLEFSANNPQAPPLLTIKLRPGLQYGTNQPGATIANAGTLAVGKDLTLAAGNLDLQGQLSAGGNLTLQAQDTVRVRDSITTPFIASAGGQLLVQGNQQVDIFALNHPESGLFSGGDMVLRSANSVIGDAHYRSGSNFRVEQLDGSLGNLESPHDPVIEVAGDFTLANYTGASLQILAGGSVNIPGTVTINGSSGAFNDSSITLSDGTPLTISGTTQPTVDIRAGTTGFFGTPTAGTPTSANITIGNIDINAPNGLVFLTNQYQPNTALSGNIQVSRIETINLNGDSGDVILNSRGDITIPNGGLIGTSSSVGNAGDVTLIGDGSFSLISGTQIRTEVIGTQQGNAGNVTIKVLDNVTISDYGRNIAGGNIVNSGITTRVNQGGVGDSGNVYIQAKSLSITNNGGIAASILGQGNAGNIIVQVDNSVSIANGGFISSSVSEEGSGNGGTIQINASDSVDLSGFSSVDGSSSKLLATTGRDASGQAGRITVNTGTLRVADGAVIDTSTLNSSDGGSVAINANSLELLGGGQILALTGSGGTAGNISLDVADTVTISGNDSNYLSRLTQFGLNVVTNQGGFSGIFAGGSIFGSTGNGGNLSISTRQLDVSDRGVITTTTAIFGTGDAGNLSINATDSVSVSGGGTINTSSSQGNSGNLSIFTGQLNISGEETLLATLSGTGNAGDLLINTTDSMNVSDQGIVTTSSSQGNSGNLSIFTGQLNVKDGQIDTISFGTGNAGNLAIAATDSVNVSNDGLVTTGTNESSAGNGGTLSIRTQRLDVNNGRLSTAAFGQGNAGNLSVVATDSMNVVNQGNVTTSATEGVAGNLYIETGNLSIRDNSLVFTSTVGAGNSGNLTVRAANSIEILDNSGLSSATIGSGNGGDLRIETENLVVDGSDLSADTFSSGNGGNLTIETGNLSVRNGGEVSTDVFFESSGQGGNLSVNASNSVELNGGRLVTATAGTGRAGDLTVNTRTFAAQGGGRVEAGTVGLSQGGTVTVNASESIALSGKSPSGKTPTAISALSRPPDTVDSSLWTGNANSGGVILNTKNLIIQEGAQVTTAVEGRSQTGNAGDVQVQADSFSLIDGGSITSRSEGQGRAGDISVSLNDNLRSSGGIISATSTQAGGGNVDIKASDIRLRDSSLISSSVFDSTGGGGNININSTVFIALEDSDILANAVDGRGGDIKINSPVFLADLFSSGQAVAVGRNPGDFSPFRGNGRVDISAEATGSGTSGTVTLPTIDLTRGLTQLPSDLVDAENLIDRRCTPSGVAKRSSFIVTGRGGLPPSPNEPLRGEAVIADWIPLDAEPEKRDRPNPTPHPTSTTPEQLVEAQGWVIAPNGQVILTAQAPTVTPQNPGLILPPCQDSQTTTK